MSLYNLAMCLIFFTRSASNFFLPPPFLHTLKILKAASFSKFVVEGLVFVFSRRLWIRCRLCLIYGHLVSL